MGEDQKTAFEKIIDVIAKTQTLFPYDSSKPSLIQNFGSVKELETKFWAPITFASRFLNNAEIQYRINELEFFAIR